jgi:hypothetical protein
MNATKTIPDGIYFLHPEGSAWIAACLRGGRCVGQTEESMTATHAAALDGWVYIVPMESDIEVDRELARLVVAIVLPGGDPDRVIVSRPNVYFTVGVRP